MPDRPVLPVLPVLSNLLGQFTVSPLLGPIHYVPPPRPYVPLLGPPKKLSNKMPGRFFGDTWFVTAPGHDGVSSAPTDRPEGILPQPLRWGEYER